MAFSSHAVTDTVPLKKYDVFISFRGEDTRRGFTSFLRDALWRNHFVTYLDNLIQKGDGVWAELEKAIKDSSVFLVVFSENYASSTWCLNELVEIMECKNNGQDDVVVIPVFYDIDPSDVRKQTGRYHTDLAKHTIQHGEDKIQKWKEALFEAANLAGFHSTKYKSESDMIDVIMKDVSKKLKHKCRNELRYHFIRNENYSRLESLMTNGSREVQIIGLWGMGGIGKTTIATVVYQNFSSQYDGSYLLENASEEIERHGLNYICRKLLSALLKEDLRIDSPKVIPSIVLRRLKCMKVFIVLDDLNNLEFLENLVGEERDWLRAGSRVIVTTRDKDVFSRIVTQIHEVKEMNFQNSLQLFSLNAFHKNAPKKGYEELSQRAIVYAKGIPLALKVLGSFLHSKSEKEWDSALRKLKEIPNAQIQRVLKLSYDELDDAEKNIFLDIACFFKGDEMDHVTEVLNKCDFYADIGIRNLLNKALIRVGGGNCIEMHDLIQEMGREIVRKESPIPGRRSRLWNPTEVYDVLTNNKGTRAVEAILFDVTQITHIKLSPKAFKDMSNLRLLAIRDRKKIKCKYFQRCVDVLPNSLRYLEWGGYPMKSLPSTFCTEMLVELSLQDSNVKKLWNGKQNFSNLERLNLSGSKCLRELPNLTGALNLKHINLSRCQRLALVDPSIFSLQKLENFRVNSLSLKSLCSNTCSPSLRGLFVENCFNLQEFSVPLMPGIVSKNGFSLGLAGCRLNEFPPSFLHIRNLEYFTYSIRDNLMHLPQNFAHTIWLDDPLEHKGDTSSTLCKVLASPAFLTVRHLFFVNCHNFFVIPDNINLLSSLEYLKLTTSAIMGLPETIKDLPRLNRFEVDDCKLLRSIPALPKSILLASVQHCESLQTVSPFSLRTLLENFRCGFALFNCKKLDHHSYDTILIDAIYRIQFSARLLSSFLENDEDALSGGGGGGARSGDIWYFLPAIRGQVRYFFHYHSTQASGCVELPPNLLGFTYYLVLSQFSVDYGGTYGCECWLETSSGETINITSFSTDEEFSRPDFDFISEHMFLWYDVRCMKAINGVRTSCNPKLTFRFFGTSPSDKEVPIKECGFRWIYPFEDLIVAKEEGSHQSKRSREIHELEVSTLQNRDEGFEFDEQEDTVAPTNKLEQCVFGSPSNPEADEIEDLRNRSSLEELLHIGFGGDLVK